LRWNGGRSLSDSLRDHRSQVQRISISLDDAERQHLGYRQTKNRAIGFFWINSDWIFVSLGLAAEAFRFSAARWRDTAGREDRPVVGTATACPTNRP
jgi:hypothetical protein